MCRTWNRHPSPIPCCHHREMRRVLIAVIIIIFAVAVICFFLYRFRSGRNLNVEPHAREEIEKAKRR